MSTRYPWAEFGLHFELTRLVNFAYPVTNLSTSIQTNTRTPAKVLKNIFRCSCLEVPRGSYSAMMTLSHTDSQAVLRLMQTDKSPKKWSSTLHSSWVFMFLCIHTKTLLSTSGYFIVKVSAVFFLFFFLLAKQVIKVFFLIYYFLYSLLFPHFLWNWVNMEIKEEVSQFVLTSKVYPLPLNRR